MLVQGEILKYLIQSLGKQEGVSKIVIQKLVYFLSESGLPLHYYFEPQKYGPFSVQLAQDLDDLEFWEEIDLNGVKYVYKGEDLSLNPGLMEKVDEKIDVFQRIAEGNLSFDAMEIVGTLIYCAKALLRSGMKPDFQPVYDEFVAWKGDKYVNKQDMVQRLFDSIVENAPWLVVNN